MKNSIVLGGTHDHIRLIQILQEKGYDVVLVDHLDNPIAKSYANEHIQESTLDLSSVLALAKRIKPEIVIATCIDQALLTMAYVSEELGLPCHVDFQTALRLTNKAYMKREFSKNAIPTSKYVVLDKTKKTTQLDLRFPLVVKPADSNGSKGITRVNVNRALEQALQVAYSYTRSGDVVIEEYLDGDEFSVDVAVKEFEPTVVMVTKNTKMRQNTNSFTIIQNTFPATDNPEILAKINEVAKKIVLAYSLRNGPLLIQLIYNGGSFHIVEISARLGGGSKHHLIKAVTGFDFLKWFVNMFFSELGNVSLQNQLEFASIRYVYARRGKIKEFLNFDRLIDTGLVEECYYYKSPGTMINNHISSADRVAGMLVSGLSPLHVVQKIETAMSDIVINNASGKNMVLR